MALKIAVDVNRYSDFFRGVAEAVNVISSADHVLLPFVVVAELRAGFLRGSRQLENNRELSQFLQKDRVSILYADEGTIQTYATLQSNLRQAGTPIPANDLWIAALVLQHGLVLFSRDKHFDHVRQLPRI